jgi:prepilin-type processing-associated H-X9-DG protein
MESEPITTETTPTASTIEAQHEQEQPQEQQDQQRQEETATSETTAPQTTTTSEEPTTSGSGETFATPEEREAATQFLINFVGATCTVFTLASTNERRIAIEALRMADHVRASLELQAATADEQQTHYPSNYVFLDGHVVEIPSGIDPSFLSALPDSLRREVIVEQLRILGIDIRNRPIPESAQQAQAAAAAGNDLIIYYTRYYHF